MADGTEFDAKAGDITRSHLSPTQDAECAPSGAECWERALVDLKLPA
jgi:hypothetical protein